MTRMLQDYNHNVLKKLHLAASRSTEYSRRHFKLYGYLSVLLPLGYIIDQLVGKPHFDTLAIRTTAFILCIPLLMVDKVNSAYSKYIPAYFVLLIAYVFPFTYGFMLTFNAAFTPEGQESEMLWILQYFISLFLFIQLTHSGLLSTFLWSAASFACVLPVVFLDHVNWDEIQRVMLYPISAYLTALILGIITNRNVDYVNSEKLRAASALGSNIAHELRTPLASIRTRARGIGKHLDDLVAGYETAKASGLDVPNISARRIVELEAGLSAIEDEVEYSNTIINMLLINTSDKPISEWDFDIFNAGSCVEEAVARYPFNNSAEKKLISIEVEDDFSISAPRLMVVHVLFNLIKNGLYSVQRSGKGSVVIRLETAKGRNLISVQDSGAGIPTNIQGQIFDRFFTTIHFGQGAGIGLSFCKMVMQGIEGEIQCESEEGEYTTFRLYFPEVGPLENARSHSLH